MSTFEKIITLIPKYSIWEKAYVIESCYLWKKPIVWRILKIEFNIGRGNWVQYLFEKDGREFQESELFTKVEAMEKVRKDVFEYMNKYLDFLSSIEKDDYHYIESEVFTKAYEYLNEKFK